MHGTFVPKNFHVIHFTSLHLTSPHLTSPHFTSPHFTYFTSLHLTSLHFTSLNSLHFTSLHFTLKQNRFKYTLLGRTVTYLTRFLSHFESSSLCKAQEAHIRQLVPASVHCTDILYFAFYWPRCNRAVTNAFKGYVH